MIAIAWREPSAAEVEARLFRAEIRELSAATYVEIAMVLMGLGRQAPERAADLLRRFIEDAGITVVPFDAPQAAAAAAAGLQFGKGRHPARLNFGDSFAYALAKVSGEPLLCKGADFARTDVALVTP